MPIHEAAREGVESTPSAGKTSEDKPRTIQLKSNLRTMGFDDGARALRPEPGGSPPSGPPVQLQDGADAAAPADGSAAQSTLKTPTNSPDGSDAAAVLGKMTSAFTTLEGMKRGDAAIAGPLGDILGPLGVAVPHIESGDERHASEALNDAVMDATVAVHARLPESIAGKPKPTTIEEVRAIDNEFEKHLQANKTAHPDTKYRPDLLILNKVFGLRELMRGWFEASAGGKEGRKPTSAGKAMAAYALSLVGRVESHQKSGKEVVAKDKAGQDKKVDACVGCDLLWTIFREGTAKTIQDNLNGEAGVIDPDITKPSWCGIFANWVAIKAGLAGAVWPDGGGGVDIVSPSKTNATTPAAKIKPLKADPVTGDIAYSQANNQHYCIVLRVEGDTVITVDGNTSGGGSTTGGKIMTNARSKGWYSGFYEWK